MSDPFEGPGASKGTNRRGFIVGGALLATAGAAWALEPHERVDVLGKRKLEELLPEKLGPWRFHSNSGLVVPPSDQLSDQLYSQLLNRVYVAPETTPIMILVAQSASQTGILQVHRPEVCYPAGGYQLSPRHTVDLPLSSGTLRTTAFTATAASRIEHMIYWTRVGSAMPTTWAEQRWAVARANINGQLPDAVLVRISTLSSEREASFALLKKFASTLVSQLPASTRNVLIAGERI